MEKKIEITRQRSNIYKFLAMAFRQSPSLSQLESFRKSEMIEIFNSEKAIEDIKTKNIKKLQENLEIEFTRLFIGPGKHISPYESTWVSDDGQLWGETTVRIKLFIEAFGIKYAEHWNGLPDHISVEFEFMQKLIVLEKSFWEINDQKKARQCLESQKKFSREHIKKWVPEFCHAIIGQTREPFYREISKFTKEFLEYDDNQVDELLA